MSKILSVIVSTHNRTETLRVALLSLLNQSAPPDSYEIVIADSYSNNNGAENKALVDELKEQYSQHEIIYIYNKIVGGWTLTRTKAIHKASSEFIAIGDDDFIAGYEYVKSAISILSIPNIGIAEGRMLPKWEIDPPAWIANLWSYHKHGKYLTDFTLLDFGDKQIDIPWMYAMGSNFAFRKSVFFSCGGFGPDGFGGEYVLYNGSGENFFAKNVHKAGHRIVYEPMMFAYHKIDSYRFTIDYFTSRSYYYGVTHSFDDLRRVGRVPSMFELIKASLRTLLSSIRFFASGNIFEARRRLAFGKGYIAHSTLVRSDDFSKNYCLMPNWLDFDFGSLKPLKFERKSLW